MFDKEFRECSQIEVTGAGDGRLTIDRGEGKCAAWDKGLGDRGGNESLMGRDDEEKKWTLKTVTGQENETNRKTRQRVEQKE